MGRGLDGSSPHPLFMPGPGLGSRRGPIAEPPVLAQGQGLPSCWDSGQVGRAEATPEGTSPSGERLPVTLDHDPRHVVV